VASIIQINKKIATIETAFKLASLGKAKGGEFTSDDYGQSGNY